MMGLVRLALRRPYTSAMVAFFVMLAGALSLTRMVVDIFPKIDIPVVLVAWNYGGLSAEEMERRVVLVAERSYAQNVDGVDRIESRPSPAPASSRSISPPAPISAAPWPRSTPSTTRSCASCPRA